MQWCIYKNNGSIELGCMTHLTQWSGRVRKFDSEVLHYLFAFRDPPIKNLGIFSQIYLVDKIYMLWICGIMVALWTLTDIVTRTPIEKSSIVIV